MKFKKNVFIPMIIILIAIIGLFLSGILTLAKYNNSIAALCGEDVNNGCNTVQNSAFSNIVNYENDKTGTEFKIPLTLLGIIFYFIVMVIGIDIYRNDMKISKKKMNIFFWIVVGGLIFSIVYTLIQAFVIEAYCKFCLISAFDVLILFGIFVWLNFFNK